MQIAGLRFLVAENEPFHREWLVAMLNQLGADHVVEAEDGQAALKALHLADPAIDISLIEIDMPGMDGMELIRHISKEDTRRAVIVVSRLDQALLFSVETMSKAYGVELLGTIVKPATPEALQAAIDRFQDVHRPSKSYSSVPAMSFDDVREGLDKQQFLPLFQPKIDLATRKVVGVEAFARWEHPKYGRLTPPSFIPLLEVEQAMSRLTSAMIEQSVAAGRGWRAQGFDLTISINVSPSVLGIENFAEQVIAFATTQNVQPASLIFEITEAATVSDNPYFLENLVRLRMHGFGVSVDDYGTGGSSLQQLMRIPFSELKIDRTFVSGAAHNRAVELVLSSSLDVCRQLDRQSVAVGVETKEDWEFLIRLGCTYAQGYYIAKPMEAAALPIWMGEWALFF